jgi:hypothetical protein
MARKVVSIPIVYKTYFGAGKSSESRGESRVVSYESRVESRRRGREFSEVATDVSASGTPADMQAAEASSEDQPGTNVADTSATTEDRRAEHL